MWWKVLGLGSKKRSNEIRQHSICIHLRNATGPLEQYHNERPPAAPETKTFQGWNGHRSYIKLYQVIHGSSQTSHLQPPGPGRPSWSYCGCQSSWYRRKTIEIDETYRNIWIWSIDIDIYMKSFTLLYVGWLAPLFSVRPGMPTTWIFSSPWPTEAFFGGGGAWLWRICDSSLKALDKPQTLWGLCLLID